MWFAVLAWEHGRVQSSTRLVFVASELYAVLWHLWFRSSCLLSGREFCRSSLVSVLYLLLELAIELCVVLLDPWFPSS